MKIEILKDGLYNKETKDKLKKGDVLTVDKKRGEKAIKAGKAKEIKPEDKESTQEKVSKKTTKK